MDPSSAETLMNLNFEYFIYMSFLHKDSSSFLGYQPSFLLKKPTQIWNSLIQKLYVYGHCLNQFPILKKSGSHAIWILVSRNTPLNFLLLNLGCGGRHLHVIMNIFVFNCRWKEFKRQEIISDQMMKIYFYRNIWTFRIYLLCWNENKSLECSFCTNGIE